VLLLAALATVVLGGCGGDDGDSTTTRTTAGRVAPASSARPRVAARIVGSRLSAQALADAETMKPTAAGPRSEFAPLSPRAFRAPVAHYRAYSRHTADAMAAPVAQLTAALRRGDRAAAQAAWGRAYDRYLLLGAAYGALGDLDTAIDGTPGGLARGVNDPHFSGLHRIEHGLWTGAPLTSLVPWSVTLGRDVHRLRHAVRTIQIDPLEYATRAHEILEDAQRDMLSDVSAPWSGAGVRATADGAAATHEVIATLVPLLSGRGDALAEVQYALAQLTDELAHLRRAHHGRWPTVRSLGRRQHELLDGRLGAVLEALSAVPGALETQLAPAIPPIRTTTNEPAG
jgi:high-affinity iron transporter